MTPEQLAALKEYVAAVCWHMLRHESQPGDMLIGYRSAAKTLEAVFGKKLPTFDPFAEPVPKPFTGIDL